MRILWVEDKFTDEKQHGWFTALNAHVEIIPAKDYNSACEMIAKDLNLYDLIILDINLEDSAVEGRVEVDAQRFDMDIHEFLKESGFHLFIQLMELGFPKQRIIFFTGNVSETPLQRALEELRQAYSAADSSQITTIFKEQIFPLLSNQDQTTTVELIQQGNPDGLFKHLEPLADSGDTRNTYNSFKERFYNARIKPPRAIKKGENEQTDLMRWAKPYLENNYLRLRRGIIDGCQHLQQLLRDDPTSLRTDKFVPTSSTSYVADYLRVLEQFLPMQKPANPAALYKLFIRTLAHEWDDCNPWKTTVNNKDKRIFLAFAKIMKTTRNWMAHSQLFDNVKEQYIAYLFLINMRALFDLPPTTQAYETILLQLFKNPLTPEEFSTITGKDAKERNIPLVGYYIKIANKINSFDEQIEKATYFHDWLNNAQKSRNFVEKHKDMLLTGLLQEFWYLTSHQYITDPKPTGSSIGIFYNFNYFNYNAKPWLQEFGQHFYKMSFPD